MCLVWKRARRVRSKEQPPRLQQRLCWAQLVAVWEEIRKGELSFLSQIAQQDLQLFPRETQKLLLFEVKFLFILTPPFFFFFLSVNSLLSGSRISVLCYFSHIEIPHVVVTQFILS